MTASARLELRKRIAESFAPVLELDAEVGDPRFDAMGEGTAPVAEEDQATTARREPSRSRNGGSRSSWVLRSFRSALRVSGKKRARMRSQ